MTMLAEQLDFVIGVDTHKQTHSAVIVTAAGGEVEAIEVEASSNGYRRLLRFVEQRAAGRRLWAVEGTGSYGAGLTRFLLERVEWVAEIDRPQRTGRRGQAKSDQIDALSAAREALSREHLTQPRQRGRREAQRVLLATQRSMVRVRTQALNQIQALVMQAPDEIRSRLGKLGTPDLVASCASLRISESLPIEARATLKVLRLTARHVQMLTADIEGLESELKVLCLEATPELLQEKGVGPISATQLLCSWSHPGRIRSEAAFAKLAGASPLEASSGQVVRHRLNRGGDRQLNRALHTIVLSRSQHDQRTRDYIARRKAQGRSDREIRRCLKRYVARHLFRLLEANKCTDA
jgi:transposase